MVLKLSLWSHFQRLWILLIYFSMIYFLMWAVDFDEGILYFGVFMFGVLIVPSLLVHLNHYKYCRSRTVTLLGDMIKVEAVDTVLSVDANDITCITVYMSGARSSNLAIQSFPFENYFYCKVDTTSQGSFFLSSLFSDKLVKLLEERYDVTFVRESKYYPIIN